MSTPAVFKPLGFDKEKLFTLMKEHNLGGILLTSPENVYYTTGYTTLPSSGNPILYSMKNNLPFFSYMDSDGQVTLLCWSYATQNVEFGVDKVVGFKDFSDSVKVVKSHLKEKFHSDMIFGIESSCPYDVLELIKVASNPKSLFVVDELLLELRLIKSEEEIAYLEKIVQITEKTLTELFPIVHEGISRPELMREAKYRMYKNGATGLSHLTFSFGKANAEFEIEEILEKGDLVTMDLGGIYHGYVSDNRREMFAGAVPSSLYDRKRAMTEIVLGTGAALKPGAEYTDVFKVAMELFSKYKIERFSEELDRVGHHIGLQTEEMWLSKDLQGTVKNGMVIVIEMFTKTEDGFFIGNEDTFVVGDSGSTSISTLPREIRTV